MDYYIDPKTDTRNLVDEYKGLANDDIKNILATKSFDYHVAIENFQHDFNIGTIVRNANAFNARGVHIVGKRQWNKRGAMVTDKYLQVYHHPSVEVFYQWVLDSNLKCIGIDNIPGSVYLSETTLPAGSVLVFGQEGPGLSTDMQKICEKIVAIKQYGSTRSVNVGVASGIIMNAWVEQNI